MPSSTHRKNGRPRGLSRVRFLDDANSLCDQKETMKIESRVNVNIKYNIVKSDLAKKCKQS